jgi:hypothetical protein
LDLLLQVSVAVVKVAYLLQGTLLGLADDFVEYFSSPTKAIELLATSIPKQANFFINYVMINWYFYFIPFLDSSSQLYWLHVGVVETSECYSSFCVPQVFGQD